MRNDARRVLNAWNGDLAIIGVVNVSEQALNLWLVPKEGEGTLSRGDRPYPLEHATLPLEFHEDVGWELTAMAFSALDSAIDEACTTVHTYSLEELPDKVSNLLSSNTLGNAEASAALQVARGNALTILGERQSDMTFFEEAVTAYSSAFEVYTAESAPLNWARTQVNFGAAIFRLAETEREGEFLDEAKAAFTAALEV